MPSSPASEPASDIQLRDGVAGQLRENSFGTVRETERLEQEGCGHKMAWRPRVAFSFIISLTCCLLAAIRNSSISSVLSFCLELLRLRCEVRESQLLSMRERTEEQGMLNAISELIDPQLSSLDRCDRGVTMP